MTSSTTGRSRIYGLLSNIYYQEPSQRFLRSFKNITFLELLQELGVELDDAFLRTPLPELAEQLAVEYTGLFLGPGPHVYPYESAYGQEERAEGRDVGLEVKRLIAASGLTYAPQYSEAPDHISIQLEFMEKLTEAEAAALDAGDHDRALGFLEFEQRFLDEHLVQWVPQFADKVAERASLSFYREMAGLTKAYVLAEARDIEVAVEDARAG